MKLYSLVPQYFTELANTMKYGGGLLYNFVFAEFPFKTASDDVTTFNRIARPIQTQILPRKIEIFS